VEQIARSFGRLFEYPLWEVAVELALFWLLVYAAYRFVRGTRAAGAFKGALVVLIIGTVLVRAVDQVGVLPRIGALSDKILGFAALALLVTFQPELRRAFIRLGEAPFFRGGYDEARHVAKCLSDAAGFLSKNKFGMIVAIERSTGLRDFAESGRILNADLSPHLLNSIFWPSSPLHDMGVIIQGEKILAAGVQFPLAQPAEMPLTHLGTRHRAAVGLSKRTDALVIVVSEETGTISVAEFGELKRSLNPDQLHELIVERLAGAQASAEKQSAEDPAREIEEQIESQLEEAADGSADNGAKKNNQGNTASSKKTTAQNRPAARKTKRTATPSKGSPASRPGPLKSETPDDA
jgi:diadenylate cyclase